MERVRYKDKPKKKTNQVVDDYVGRGHPHYRPEFAREAKFLCQRGALMSELADTFDVSTRTIQYWLLKHPEFNAAVQEGLHETFDPRIVRSMAEQAIGYYVDVEEAFVVGTKTTDKRGNVVERKWVKKEQIRRYIAPNVTAGIFLLKNHLPDQYSDVRKLEVSEKPLESSDALKEQLASMLTDLSSRGMLQLSHRKMKDVTPKE